MIASDLSIWHASMDRVCMIILSISDKYAFHLVHLHVSYSLPGWTMVNACIGDFSN